MLGSLDIQITVTLQLRSKPNYSPSQDVVKALKIEDTYIILDILRHTQ